VELYLHSPICFQGILLNSLIIGTGLPFTEIVYIGVMICTCIRQMSVQISAVISDHVTEVLDIVTSCLGGRNV
jgi:hypothetical protein